MPPLALIGSMEGAGPIEKIHHLAQPVAPQLSMPRGVVTLPRCSARNGPCLRSPLHSRYINTSSVKIQGRPYAVDEWTNVKPTIVDKVGRDLFYRETNPLCILRKIIESYLTKHGFLVEPAPPAVVSVLKNFDELEIPPDAPARSKSDNYYVNKDYVLRTHTSAHELEILRKDVDRYIMSADVYRRDEIDSTHYPVFHQMEGVCVIDRNNIGQFEAEVKRMREELRQQSIVNVHHTSTEGSAKNMFQSEQTEFESRICSEHLKLTLSLLTAHVLSHVPREISAAPSTVNMRWNDDNFFWTQPSYELEVDFAGKWMELLGCGVVRQSLLERGNVSHKVGWAFGTGLDRLAMALFAIPDIRLFWSEDPRFLSQFSPGTVSKFVPFSRHEALFQDLSMWIPDTFHANDFADLVRIEAGDLVEGMDLIDDFVHPKTARHSVCHRIAFRSMERSLSHEEVGAIMQRIRERATADMGVEVR